VSEAGSGGQIPETGGGSQGEALSESKELSRWDLPMEGALGLGISCPWRGSWEGDSGCLRVKRLAVGIGDGDRGRPRSSHRARVRPNKSTRVVTRLAGFPSRDGEVAVAGDAASTAWLPKVGDAGNGYPALPWTVLVRVRARAWTMAGGKVAVGRTVKAGRLGVEVPAGAR
jgi:hypothetical protein